jgi:subtilase family serine protease
MSNLTPEQQLIVESFKNDHETIVLSNIFINKDAFINTNINPNVSYGYNVNQIRKAYGYNDVSQNSTKNVHIAIVIAYSYPGLQKDFDKFCQLNNLPPLTLNIIKINPNTPNVSGWDVEICLDTQWAYAICPYAKISVIQAASSSLYDMLKAIQIANTLKPHVVSMSWGGSEFSGITSSSLNVFDDNILYIASSGDSNNVEWPSTNPSVVSVGATSLYLNSLGNYQQETTWNLTGCGYSKYFSIPNYQKKNINTNSKYRMTVDISSVGNPNTGCYVYFNGKYLVYGGTSLSAPIIAGTMAIAISQRLAKNLPALNSNPNSKYCVQNILYNYYKTNGKVIFHDITSGNSGNYFTQGGYDIPTGLGSPNVPTFISYLASSSGSLVTNYGYGSVNYMDHYNAAKNRIEINMDVSHQNHDKLLILEGFVENNNDGTFTLHVKPKNTSILVEPLNVKKINESQIPNAVSKYVEQVTGKHFQ